MFGPIDKNDVYGEKFCHESGMAMAYALLVIMVLVAVVGSTVSFALTTTKLTGERMDSSLAFYLADGAIETAKFEIGEDTDPDNDGIGNVTGSTSLGSYSVTVTDLGGGYHQLLSTGTVEGRSVKLEVILERVVNTRFPQGAMSILGNVGDFDIDIEEDGDLIIDGGNTPAISVSDFGAYQTIGGAFAGAIDSGDFPSINLSGTPLDTFGGHDLPIAYTPSYDSNLENLMAL